jgi:hypothetical protein
MTADRLLEMLGITVFKLTEITAENELIQAIVDDELVIESRPVKKAR